MPQINLGLGPQQKLSLTHTMRLMRVLGLSPAQVEDRLRELIQAGVVIEVDASPAEHLSTAIVASRPYLQDSQDADYDEMERLPSSRTLNAHLREQLYASRLVRSVLTAAAVIVDSLNDDGFLQDDLATIASWSALGEERLAQGLATVQSLDPIGVGARDLRECLLLQLRALPPHQATRDRALEAIESRTMDQFIKLCARSTDALRDVFALIRTLNWHPGAAFASVKVATQPDVLVRKHVGCWLVERNPRAMPRVQVCDDRYARLAPSLCASIKEAKRFVKDLALRDDLVLDVARLIVEKQTAFLEHGTEQLVPLARRDIAAQLGVHETTVSRIVADRSAWTKRGLIGFDRFFTSGGVATADGTRMSRDAIKERIRHIIAGSPGSPGRLSDAAIERRLLEQGIPLSRRGVTKYRHQMASCGELTLAQPAQRSSQVA